MISSYTKFVTASLLLIGILVGPVLAEIIGFISTFISIANEELGESLMNIVTKFSPFSAIIFVASLVTVSQLSSWLPTKIWVYVLSLAFLISGTYGLLEEGTLLESFFYNLNYVCQIASLFTGALILYRYNQSNMAVNAKQKHHGGNFTR